MPRFATTRVTAAMRTYHRFSVVYLPRPRILVGLGLCSTGIVLAAVTMSLTPTATIYKWTQLSTTTLSERQHSGVGVEAATAHLVVFGVVKSGWWLISESRV